MTRLALLTTLCVLAVAAVAISAIPRPSPLAPKNKASLPVGKTPTFKFRSTGTGPQWVHVSKSARRGADGVIKFDADLGQAKKRPGTTTFTYKPKYYSFSTFWANRKRTYYWQAFRISCGEEDTTNEDCKVEGPVRRFTLR